MAVTGFLYNAVFDHAFQKRIDIDSDAIKVALVTSAYTPNQDTHDFFNDVTNELSAGSGYTAGGITLTGVTWALDAATNTWKFDANDVTWSTSTLIAAKAVVYDSTPGTAATNPLIGYIDFGGNVSSTAGDFTIAFAGTGIFTITSA